MATIAKIKTPSVREQVSAEEWAVRVDLAACYRLVAHFGWDDLIYTHNSARVPGAEDHFLLNPFGLAFTEVTASNLVKIDTDGNKVMDSPYDVLNAGFTIHSAVHMARPDAGCVMHTHTIAGMAVSAQKDGLLPLTQTSMRFYGHIGYHDYEGFATDLEERQRLAEDLGQWKAMILRNHGLLAVGVSVAEAFSVMRDLERSCQAQVAAQAGGGALVTPDPKLCEETAIRYNAIENMGSTQWAALLRMLDGIDPSYAD